MSHAKSSFLAKLLAPLSGTAQLEAENARLEAFLAAFPGHYCGFARDGSIAYSQGFCQALGLTQIRSPADIQNALSAGDAVAFESSWSRLKQEGTGFTLYGADRTEEKHLKIAGARGVDRMGGNAFHILWVEDITSQITAQDTYREETAPQADSFEGPCNYLIWPLWRRDESQKLIWVNPAYAQGLGESAEDILSAQKELAASVRKKPGKVEQPPGPDLAKAALAAGKSQCTEAHVILSGKRHLMRFH
ncbi:MAG: histidine kinase, partial [Alphaproteobacteria bacterium]|nr:histidine kinase [Alphaproteobacteria bacterium]